MIINKSGAFQLPFSGQMQKNIFCVQKNQAITSEFIRILLRDFFSINQSVRPSGLKGKSGPLDEEPL
jgi:hypothetical protein